MNRVLKQTTGTVLLQASSYQLLLIAVALSQTSSNKLLLVIEAQDQVSTIKLLFATVALY